MPNVERRICDGFAPLHVHQRQAQQQRNTALAFGNVFAKDFAIDVVRAFFLFLNQHAAWHRRHRAEGIRRTAKPQRRRASCAIRNKFPTTPAGRSHLSWAPSATLPLFPLEARKSSPQEQQSLAATGHRNGRNVINRNFRFDFITMSAVSTRVDCGCLTTKVREEGAEHDHYRSRLSPELSGNCLFGWV